MNLVKYILTAPLIDGKVVFGFDGDQLRYFEDTGMNMRQLEWVIAHAPVTEEKLKAMAKIMRGGQLQMIPPDLSFEVFWDAYKKKVNKQRCIPLWKKLSDVDRIDCIMSLKAYESFLKRDGRAKLDPENYLKRRSWENNWNAI